MLQKYSVTACQAIALSIVQNDRQRGLITLYKDKWRKVEMKASDFNGNESTYQFQLKRAPSFEPPATPSPNVRHGHIQTVKSQEPGCHIFPSSLARDITFGIKSTGNDTATQFEIGDYNEPILDGIRLAVKIPDSLLVKKINCVWSGLAGQTHGLWQ